MKQTFIFRSDMPNKDSVWSFFIQSFKEIFSGGGCQIDIQPYKKNKTEQQRKYAHACIAYIAKEQGSDPKHLKVRIKQSIGLVEVIWADGNELTIEKSTEELNREEYGLFIDAIRELAEFLNVKIPQPRMFGMEI